MDILTMLFLLFVACLLWAGAEFLKMRSEVRYLRTYIADLESGQNVSQPALARPSDALEAITLANAGQALKNPPTSLQETLNQLQHEPVYTFPLGWYVGATSKRVILQTARFVGDVNHILLTGQSDSGKDNAALNIMLSLAKTHTPQQAQFAILDGKGLDWLGWQSKAHCWHVATDPEDIAPAMQRLTAERKRRREVLASAGVSKWDTYKGGDLPLLVVFISELLLLENAVGKSNLTSWLNAELTAARAFGIRYIIATQNASNFSTQWRSQISLFIAGFQPSDSADMPNTGLYTKELLERNLVAPSNLPAPASGAGGIFLALQGGAGVNIRTSLIGDDQRDYWLKQLPNAPKVPSKSQPSSVSNNQSISDPILADLLSLDTPDLGDYVLEDLPDETEAVERSIGLANGQKEHFVEQSTTRRTNEFSPSGGNASAFYVELPLADEIVPFAEQRRIIEAAQTVKTKRQLSLKLYNTDGGAKSTWVRLVCDALGLLQGGAAVGK